MTKTRKNLLAAAAFAGLIAGTVAMAQNKSDEKGQTLAGKPVSSGIMSRMACNGCGGKSNSVVKN